MKLLITFEDRLRHDSTGVYFKRAFEQLLGADNVVHLYNEQLGDARRSDFEHIIKIDDGLEQHRFPKHLGPASWYVIDCHIDLEWRRKLHAEAGFHNLFFAQKRAVAEDWGGAAKHWVPLACEEASHWAGQRPRKYDVCFIGNFHSRHASRRMDYCDALFARFPNFYYGRRFFREMAEKFAESRLVWNCALNGDINMRFFEAQMSGSALLTDQIPEMDLLGFREGTHYIGYNDKDEMLAKAEYYLANESEREMIAFNARLLVLNKFQYIHRARQMWEILTKEVAHVAS